MKCVVLGCRRERLAPRNGVVFATCADHCKVAFEGRQPEWLRRMQERGLPAKELIGA